MIEFIFETIFQGIFESLPKYIGLGFKWLFYLGKRPIIQIKKENWNARNWFCTIIWDGSNYHLFGKLEFHKYFNIP